MEQSGFSKVQVHTVVRDWPVVAASWLPERILGLAPRIKILFGQFSEENHRNIMDRMTELMQENLDRGRTSLTTEAPIGIGVK